MSGLSDELLAPANGIELAYQEVGDPDGEPLLLIMGLAMQMLGWDERFCELLADRGFRVIRFDNRDIGHSTMLDHLGVASRFDIFSGRRSTAPYLLADMAEDTFGLLDHLGIESAHVVGVSMGGMIAQTMAIEQPERVRSLVSMLSTTGNRRIGVPALKTWGLLFAAHPRVEADYVDRGIKTFRIIGSPRYPMSREYITEKAQMKVGYFTPGTHIPIYGDDKLLQDQPDYALILAWNFADEIMANLHEFKERGGKFIIPIPKPKIV